MPYGTYEIAFSPLTFADPADIEYLSNLLANQGVVARFNLHAHRRRVAWGVTVPVGVFDNDFTSAAMTWEQHIASRDRITKLAAATLPKGYRPIARRYDVLEHEGRLYYHPEALRVYAQHVDHPAFLRALYRFLEAAEKQPQLIVPPRERAPFVPLADRVATYGHPARGPDWSEDEDAVLRRWFGQRTVGEHAGKHIKLTDAEWARVLTELPRRNKNSVRGRIVELNKKLQAEFFRDGFVGQHRLREYMARVLGERPRIPVRPTRRRPRSNALAGR
jgi:hypothetical protein